MAPEGQWSGTTDRQSRTDLAGKTRSKLFALLGEDIDLVVTTCQSTIGYLSGYFSLLGNLAKNYQTAALVDRNGATLIVAAADAGPALETLGDPARVVRYGFFCFEDEALGLGFDEPGAENFEAAVRDTLQRYRDGRPLVGLHGNAESPLWGISQQVLAPDRLRDVSAGIVACRSTKLPEEIAKLSASTAAVERGLRAVAAQVSRGSTEHEIASIMASEIGKHGGIVKFLSVTSGARSALADSYPSERRLAAGDFLRIDAGCTLDGYSSDIARTFVCGEPTKAQEDHYRAIRQGLEYELSLVRAGRAANEIFEKTVKEIRKSGIPSYQRQHCGHGIGIDGYEFPLIGPRESAPLAAGMCLCVETPYYKLGWGGLMIENTIAVTNDGYKLFNTLPMDLQTI